MYMDPFWFSTLFPLPGYMGGCDNCLYWITRGVCLRVCAYLLIYIGLRYIEFKSSFGIINALRVVAKISGNAIIYVLAGYSTYKTWQDSCSKCCSSLNITFHWQSLPIFGNGFTQQAPLCQKCKPSYFSKSGTPSSNW